MGAYKPLKITGTETGLVQQRESFLLPNDAYTILKNAFVWRERIKRKQGCDLLCRLRRQLTAQPKPNTNGTGTYDLLAANSLLNAFKTAVVPEPNAEVEPGTVVITVHSGFPDASSFTDDGQGGWINNVGNTYTVDTTTSTINYVTGEIHLVWTVAPGVLAVVVNFNYFPSLQTMGLRTRERDAINDEQTIAFDLKYAYLLSGAGSSELASTAPTTWSGTDADFFWTTNFWVNASNQKLFWATNFSGIAGDPIRYHDGTTWTSFAPQIDIAGTKLQQALMIVPFRGRLLVMNTLEGVNLVGSTQYYQRIRWAAIGNPLAADAWRDDIRGKGGFLDIPTSEEITSAGFVRDNLVIFCERSTWQLRYTGNTIAPFQIERVNTELGAESTFGSVQFDTSLVGIGDKGVVECDSFKSTRIDIKIPDLTYAFSNINNGPIRVHGIRDFKQRLAYWCFLIDDTEGNYPNRRLVYNYENQSWAIFEDSFTCFGNFQLDAATNLTWGEAEMTWSEADFLWSGDTQLEPVLIAGNQQGYVFLLDRKVTNDPSLSLSGVSKDAGTNRVRFEVPNHNLENGQVIRVTGFRTTDGNYGLFEGDIFCVTNIKPYDKDKFELQVYEPSTDEFDTYVTESGAIPTYLGGAQITVRDGFQIMSKRFNALDDGQNIQMGYLDVLTDTTASGEITLKVYVDYHVPPTNVYDENAEKDTFFNSAVPTSAPVLGVSGQNLRNWHRVYCPTRGAFLKLEWTLSNGQLIGIQQESEVGIHAQILWIRNAGRLGL